MNLPQPPQPQAPAANKPGVKTSEFWLVAMALVLGTALAWRAAELEHDGLMEVAKWMLGGASSVGLGGYALGRSQAKKI